MTRFPDSYHGTFRMLQAECAADIANGRLKAEMQDAADDYIRRLYLQPPELGRMFLDDPHHVAEIASKHHLLWLMQAMETRKPTRAEVRFAQQSCGSFGNPLYWRDYCKNVGWTWVEVLGVEDTDDR